jgi:hypothetical protein
MSKFFNPRPIRPKPNALKTKSTSNIQAMELNVFEIFKQEKFEDEQLIRYFLFQFQFHIVIKLGWQVQLHFTNNISKSPKLSQSIHLILAKGLCSTKVGTPYPNK